MTITYRPPGMFLKKKRQPTSSWNCRLTVARRSLANKLLATAHFLYVKSSDLAHEIEVNIEPCRVRTRRGNPWREACVR